MKFEYMKFEHVNLSIRSFFCTLEMKIYSILDFKCTFEFDMKFEYMKFEHVNLSI